MNEGKKFEQDFIRSVPETVFKYRFKDGTAGWGEQDKTRFQAPNICDFLLFDGRLWLLELKSHKGKSIPFSCIRENQLTELSKAEIFDGIIPGFVFNFRDIAKTYFLHIRHAYYYYHHADRKSFPLDFVQEYGQEIRAELKKVRYRYDVQGFLMESEGLKC
jgi:recombination protein U